jgi:hypothetical protein
MEQVETRDQKYTRGIISIRQRQGQNTKKIKGIYKTFGILSKDQTYESRIYKMEKRYN